MVKCRQPPSPKKYVRNSLCDPNWWPADEPESPPKSTLRSERRPIFPWRYGALRNPERYPPFPAHLRPSPSSAGPILEKSHRPLTAMMDRSGGVAGGEGDDSTAAPRCWVISGATRSFLQAPMGPPAAWRMPTVPMKIHTSPILNSLCQVLYGARLSVLERRGKLVWHLWIEISSSLRPKLGLLIRIPNSSIIFLALN